MKQLENKIAELAQEIARSLQPDEVLNSLSESDMSFLTDDGDTIQFETEINEIRKGAENGVVVESYLSLFDMFFTVIGRCRLEDDEEIKYSVEDVNVDVYHDGELQAQYRFDVESKELFRAENVEGYTKTLKVNNHE